MIYSFPFHGKTVQVDLDMVTPQMIEAIRGGASGPSKVRMKTGEVVEIDNSQFSPQIVNQLRQNLSKDHYHPMDYEAPMFQGGISERIHELTNPGERGETGIKSYIGAQVRPVLGAVKGFGETALGAAEAYEKSPANPAWIYNKALDLAKAERPKIDYQKAREKLDSWFQTEVKKYGGADIYSGLGEFIPDALLIAATGGAGEAGIEAATKAPVMTKIASRAAKLITKGVSEESVTKWAANQLMKPSTWKQIAATRGSALVEEIPAMVAKRTTAGQTLALGAKTAGREFLGGTAYGAVKSGGDVKESLKTGAKFAAFTPLSMGIGAYGAKRLPGFVAWADELKTRGATGEKLREWLGTGKINEDQALGWYVFYRRGAGNKLTLEEYLRKYKWELEKPPVPVEPEPEYTGRWAGTYAPKPAGPGEILMGESYPGLKEPKVGKPEFLPERPQREIFEDILPEGGKQFVGGTEIGRPKPTKPYPYKGPGKPARASTIPAGGTFEKLEGRVSPETGKIEPRKGLYQSGRGRFDPSTNTVTLFENADFSTFVHETAHIWRHNLPPALLKKIEILLGVENGNWPLEADELLATAFEKYMGDGLKTVPGALKLAFKDTERWMKDVYRNVENSPLGGTISLKLRGAFNEMLSGKPIKAGVAQMPEIGLKAAQAGEQRPVEGLQRVEEGSLLQSEKNRTWGYPGTIGEVTAEKAAALKDVKNEISDKFKVPGAVGEYWNKFNEKVGTVLYSDLTPLKKYGQDVYDAAVLNLGAKSKAYEMVSHNLRAAFAPVEGLKGPMPWRGESRYIQEVVSDVAKARRAIEIEGMGKKAGKFYTSGDAHKIIKEFDKMKSQNPELAGTVEKTIGNLKAMNDRLLRYWLDSGVINKEIYDRISKSSEFYMPYHRVFTEAERKQLAREGMSKQANSLKELKGSERESHDVVENIAMNYMDMIPSVDRHVLYAKIIDALPESVKGKVTIVKTPLAFKLKTIDAAGRDNAVKQFFVPRLQRSPSEIVFMRNGQWESWTLNDALLVDALKKTYYPDGILRAAQWMKNIKRTGVTSNPIFMARNAARDFVTRIMNDTDIVRDPRIVGYGEFASDLFWMAPKVVKKAVYEFPLAAAEVISGSTTNKNLKVAMDAFGQGYTAIGKTLGATNEYYSGQLAKNLNLSGAGGSTMRKMTRKEMGQLIRESAGIRRPGVEYLSPRTALKPLEWLNEIGRIIEQTPRLEAAQRMFEKTGSTKEAARVYRTITADFAQQGTLSKGWMGQSIPFFSAQFAGMKAEFAAIKENPIGWGAKAIELIAIPTIIYWLYKHNTEDYRRRDTMDKNMYFHLTDTFRIPKGYGLHALLSNVLERGLDRYVAHDPEAVKGLREAAKLWSPQISLPPAAGAAYGVLSGKHPYFGTDIEPKYSENLPASEREKPSTTETAKFLGRPFTSPTARISPPKIDFIINELGGGIATTATRGVDALATAGERGVKPATGLEKMPFADAFFTKPASTNPYSGEVMSFYTNMGRAESAYNSIKSAYENKNAESYKRLTGNKRIYSDAVAWEKIRSAKQMMSEMNKTYKAIRDPNFKGNEITGPLTPESKREILDRLSEKMNQLAENVNRVYYGK